MRELQDPQADAHQAGYAAHVARRLASVTQVSFPRPARNGDEIEAVTQELLELGVEALMVVMLTDADASVSLRTLARVELPLLLANIQPERAVIEDWTAEDLVFNEGVRGAQALSGALVRASVPYSVLTGDWMSESFALAFADWAAAARAARMLGGFPRRTDGVEATAVTHEADGTEALTRAAQSLFEEARACRTLAMDWNLDAILVGPSPGFRASSGRATVATLTRVHDGTTRLVVGFGEIVSGPELPRLELSHFHFRPDAGLDAFLDGWLEFGAPSNFVTALGDHGDRWRRLAELLDIDYEEI
jgi:L-arabinose isomerase